MTSKFQPGPEATGEDVFGHIDAKPTDDIRTGRGLVADDDVEGHLRVKDTQDLRSNAKVVEDDDVEGHGARGRLVEDDDDVEGHLKSR